MVKLEEVADEDLVQPQEGPIGGEDDWDTDSDSDASETSSIASSTIESETLYDRLLALQDILPPKQRRYLNSTINTTTSLIKSSLSLGGKALWIFSTSALLIGIPFAMAYQEEQQMIEMEREMKMQQSASELLTPGASLQQPGGQASPAL